MNFQVLFLISCAVLVKSQSEEKFCRYRDDAVLYPSSLWNWITGYWCYSYTSGARLNFRYNVSGSSITENNITYIIPFSRYNDTAFLYDYTDDIYLEYIRYSFKTDDYFELWKQCGKDAEECCDSHMDETNIYPNDEFPCPATWDGWTCYPSTKADTIARHECSSQAYSSTAALCTLYSEKECLENGTWNQDTNYATCAIAPVYRKRHEYHVIILYISMALSLPAVIIFCSFRKLRVMRVIHHRNLILIIIIRNILTIMSKSLIILDALKPTNETNNAMENNSIACRVLAFFEGVSKNGIYAFMLADGYYLHKLIVRIFAKDPSMTVIYILVAVSSVTPSIAWAIMKATKEDSNCWMVDEGGYQWISDGFRIGVLVINTVLLMDILRVLLMKLRQASTVNHTKSTLKATLFLIPLFGLHIILVANRNIAGNTCVEEDIYYFASYTMEGLQGMLVATCFCYLNSEVHKEIQNAFRKINLNVRERLDLKQRTSNTRRRTTAATFVRNSMSTVNYNCPKNLVDLPLAPNRVEDWLSTSHVDGVTNQESTS